MGRSEQWLQSLRGLLESQPQAGLGEVSPPSTPLLPPNPPLFSLTRLATLHAEQVHVVVNLSHSGSAHDVH